MDRAILHSDANCFYASCEMVMNPSLQGKAVAVCGSIENRHGIILAKSERAKAAGVKTGMPHWEAIQHCPELITVEPHFDIYLKFSRLLHKIYERYTDYIEPYGMDECWLDVTDSIRSPMEIAEEIRKSVKDELGLTVSIGVSFNKVFAKLGSDYKKPDAVTEITRDNFKEIVWKLPCADLLYCGRSTCKELERFGIVTIGQIAKVTLDFMVRRLGKNGQMLWLFANGMDEARVAHMDYHVPAKSVGHGITCKADLLNNDEAKKVIYSLCQDIGYKLRKMNSFATGVSITVKDTELSSRTYSTRVENRTQDESKIAKIAYKLLVSNYDWAKNIRAISVTATGLNSADVPVQSSMFYNYEKEDRQTKLHSAIDDIKNTYGKGAILPAVILDEEKMPSDNDKEIILPGMMHK